MLPLRFPNSGIRAKVFVRKIGFKLYVMRLNRVESFYAFLLRFRSECREEEGRPATTSPHSGSAARATGCGQGPMPATAKAPCRGSRQHVLPPVGMAGPYRGGASRRRQRPRPGRKGQPPTTRPQGAAARCEAARGSPVARAIACKGDRS
ncbi:hypothetical protein GW17_00021513 [Ensete ventricosum]|nr:hypothetical protein GW17_00021513 [Ensete ventricosum]